MIVTPGMPSQVLGAGHVDATEKPQTARTGMTHGFHVSLSMSSRSPMT